ncbi:MAG TPA: hypothetical protein VGD84_09725, partial [Pseudonocardiaceae bacterium]
RRRLRGAGADRGHPGPARGRLPRRVDPGNGHPRGAQPGRPGLPEVAVAGVGWLPLDPTGALGGPDAPSTGLSQATAKVRSDLPPPKELRDPPLPATGPGQSVNTGPKPPFPVWPLVIGFLALIALAGAGIPLAKAIRTARRRRRTGSHAVVAAWWEARDLLRAHGTPVTPGMTVRDLAGAVRGHFETPRSLRHPRGPAGFQNALFRETPVVDGLLSLAGQVDIALWSGGGANEGTVTAAWTAVRDIRRNLAERPFTARVRALFDPRGLLAR